MLTGVWPEKHGVTNNNFTGRDYATYPSFLTRVEALRPELATVAALDWVPLAGLPDDPGPVLPAEIDVREVVDGYDLGWAEADGEVAARAARHLREADPDAMFVDVAATALAHLGIEIDPDWGLDGVPLGGPERPTRRGATRRCREMAPAPDDMLYGIYGSHTPETCPIYVPRYAQVFADILGRDPRPACRRLRNPPDRGPVSFGAGAHFPLGGRCRRPSTHRGLRRRNRPRLVQHAQDRTGAYVR